MPASVADPIESHLRLSLSTNHDGSTDISKRLQVSCSKVLTTRIEFEQAPNYQPTTLHGLKNSCIVLKSNSGPVATASIQSRPELVEPKTNGTKEPVLPTPKLILFPKERLKLGWQGRYRVGAGLINVGNSCYLNASLQALFHVPLFVNWLHSDKAHRDKCSPPGETPDCIICAMASTMVSMQKQNTPSMKPLFITSKLKLIGRLLQHGSQEDAHEFMRLLIECMEKSYLSRCRGQNLESYSKETTPLNQIFGGYMRTEVQCSTCRAVSTTFQHFQDLQLDIHRASSVTEAIRQYFCTETMDRADYACSACRQEVQATKRFTMERAPLVLFVHLKRFTATGNKLNKSVSVPMYLDMGPYLRKKPAHKALSYRLTSVVIHYGNTANSGHYTAIGQTSTQQLYTFDDSSVLPLHTISGCAQHAYVIMYEMVGAQDARGPSPSIQSVARPVFEHTNGNKLANQSQIVPRIPTSSNGQSQSLPRVTTPSNGQSQGMSRAATPSHGQSQGMSRVATPSNGQSQGMSRVATPSHGQSQGMSRVATPSNGQAQAVSQQAPLGLTNGSGCKLVLNGQRTSFAITSNKSPMVIPSTSKSLKTPSPSKSLTVASSLKSSLVTPSSSKSLTVASSLKSSLVTPSPSKSMTVSPSPTKSLSSFSKFVSVTPTVSKPHGVTKKSKVLNGLVPYEQDSSSESEDENASVVRDASGKNVRVVRDASGGGWSVTQRSRSTSEELEEGEIRQKKIKRRHDGEHKTLVNIAAAVVERPRDHESVHGYLKNASHRGLGGHVSSWSGGRSHVDRADFHKRSRDPDRSYDEECDRGRIKKVKRSWDDRPHGFQGGWYSKNQKYGRNHWNRSRDRFTRN